MPYKDPEIRRIKGSERSRRWSRNNPKKAVEKTLRWRRKHPEKAKLVQALSARKHNLRRKYGISEADYDRLLVAQEGKCAVCRTDQTPQTGLGRMPRWHIDHDHKTGSVRGLLCFRCNSALGLLDDDPERLARAMTYLLKGK